MVVAKNYYLFLMRLDLKGFDPEAKPTHRAFKEKSEAAFMVLTWRSTGRGRTICRIIPNFATKSRTKSALQARTLWPTSTGGLITNASPGRGRSSKLCRRPASAVAARG